LPFICFVVCGAIERDGRIVCCASISPFLVIIKIIIFLEKDNKNESRLENLFVGELDSPVLEQNRFYILLAQVGIEPTGTYIPCTSTRAGKKRCIITNAQQHPQQRPQAQQRPLHRRCGTRHGPDSTFSATDITPGAERYPIHQR